VPILIVFQIYTHLACLLLSLVERSRDEESRLGAHSHPS
jgi:hypothetical protein